MPNLFDLAEARRLRDRGIDIVASYPNDSWFLQARSIAEMIAATQGSVTINDVLRVCPRPESVHPNAVGSIMRSPRLRLVSFVQSDKVSSHARRIGVYELKKQ